MTMVMVNMWIDECGDVIMMAWRYGVVVMVWRCDGDGVEI